MSVPQAQPTTLDAELLGSCLSNYEQSKIEIRKAIESVKAYAFAVQELLTAKKTLAENLLALYENSDSLLTKHATELSKQLSASQLHDKDGIKFVAQLKKAGNSCRKEYEERFATLDQIVCFANESKSKKRQEKVDNLIYSEFNAFSQQKLDLFDVLLVEVLDTEWRVSEASTIPEANSTLCDESKNLLEMRSSVYSPKMDQSLKLLMSNPVSVEYLKCFFKDRRMAESLQFWLDVQKFKKLEPRHIETGARLIYDRYILDSGDRQVNLPSELVDPIHAHISRPSSTIFDEAAKSIFELLDGNLGGFHSSIYYQKMLAHLQPLKSFTEFLALTGAASSKSRSANKSPNLSPLVPQLKLSEQTGSSPINMSVSTTLDFETTLQVGEVKVTCMVSSPGEIICGCLDGSILGIKTSKSNEKASTSGDTSGCFETIIHAPSGTVEGNIVSLMKLSANELLILSDQGVVLIFDMIKNKLVGKVGKGESYINYVCRIDSQRIWTASGKVIQDWLWNNKKKKFYPLSSREVPRPVTYMSRIDNVVWIGDNLGGVTRLNMQTLHPINDRTRVSSSPVHFCFRSESSVKLKGLTSITVKVWVCCRDGTLSVLDENGGILSKINNNVHDLPIVGAATIGKYVVLGSEDGTLSVWNKDDLVFIERLSKVHRDSISALCTSDDQSILFSAGFDRRIAVWRKQITSSRRPKSMNLSPTSQLQEERKKKSATARSGAFEKFEMSNHDQEFGKVSPLSSPERQFEEEPYRSPRAPNLDSLLIMSKGRQKSQGHINYSPKLNQVGSPNTGSIMHASSLGSTSPLTAAATDFDEDTPLNLSGISSSSKSSKSSRTKSSQVENPIV